MASSKDVFAKRKEGALDEAYNMALELINAPDPDEWDIKAFGWCVIDLIKRDVKSANQQNLQNYCLQLENLTVESSDTILSDQKLYTLKLCKPNAKDILKAKSLSKSGNHQESANLLKKILENGDHSVDVQTSLAWELYRLAKVMIGQVPPNFIGAKRNLNDYFKLQVEKPSLLHTCFLQVADKLAQDSKLNMGAFAKIWGLDNLRPEDYEAFVTEDGKVFPSLAERVVQHASKDAFVRNVLEDIQYIFPFINKCIELFPDNLWLELSKARALMMMGRNDEALIFAIDVVKNKVNDFWPWELLGDIHKPSTPEIALSCYCKALLCSKDTNFVGKVKIKLAELLINNGELARAKFEIEEIINYRIKNDQKIPDSAESLRAQSWYETTVAVESNRKFYISNAPCAEAILYSGLPWINGILGEQFHIDKKPNKPRRKLFIESNPVPFEVSVPESKVVVSGAMPGKGIRIKGEYDNEKRFQIYTLEIRETSSEWDIFSELIGVVDHINKEKELIHFIVSREIDGVLRFSELEKEYSLGDSIAIRLSKYTSKKGTRYRVLSSSATDQLASDSIFQEFNDEVRVDNSMGFTQSDIFIPPALINKYNIEDGSNISGDAILNYNKKRSEWGWKAIKINQ
jgi:hypothetical protein